MKLLLQAPAKINFFLKLCGTRPNGYHNICTVMQTVSLCDELVIQPTPKQNPAYFMDGQAAAKDNLIVQAAEAFFKELGLSPQLQISLTKHIPVSAGLGGGSTDAAAVLRGLNLLYNMPLSNKKLQDLAVRLGADVPFFLQGGRCLAEGIGELLTPLPQPKNYTVFLTKQHQKQSTGQMYALADALPQTPNAGQETAAAFAAGQDLVAFALCENDFLTVSANRAAQQKMLQKLYSSGALLAGLSGSGPTLFGLFAQNQNQELLGTKNSWQVQTLEKLPEPKFLHG